MSREKGGVGARREQGGREQSVPPQVRRRSWLGGRRGGSRQGRSGPGSWIQPPAPACLGTKAVSTPHGALGQGAREPPPGWIHGSSRSPLLSPHRVIQNARGGRKEERMGPRPIPSRPLPLSPQLIASLRVGSLVSFFVQCGAFGLVVVQSHFMVDFFLPPPVRLWAPLHLRRRPLRGWVVV